MATLSDRSTSWTGNGQLTTGNHEDAVNADKDCTDGRAQVQRYPAAACSSASRVFALSSLKNYTHKQSGSAIHRKVICGHRQGDWTVHSHENRKKKQDD